MSMRRLAGRVWEGEKIGMECRHTFYLNSARRQVDRLEIALRHPCSATCDSFCKDIGPVETRPLFVGECDERLPAFAAKAISRWGIVCARATTQSLRSQAAITPPFFPLPPANHHHNKTAALTSHNSAVHLLAAVVCFLSFFCSSSDTHRC